MGGEKLTPCGKANCGPGSPPRGRGKALLLLDAGVVVGITPAWAGKSMPWLRPGAAHGDHPRMGGEK